MITQLHFALRDIRIKKGKIILFMLQIFIAVFFFFIATQQLLYSHQSLKEIKKLERYDITYFSQSLGATSKTYTVQTDKELEDLLDNQKKAYTTIESLKLKSLPEVDIVVGIGVFGEVFDLVEYINPYSTNDTIVLVGSKVKNASVGDFISFGSIKEENYKIMDTLPAGKNYSMRLQVKKLDNTIIILTSKNTMKRLYGNMYLNELIGNTCLINPSNSELRDYLSIMGEAQIGLSPINLNLYAQKHYQRIYIDGLIFSIFYLITLVFVFVSVIVNILQLIDSNMREYSIHLLYGALRQDIYIRTIFYAISIVTVPVLSAIYCISKLRQIEPLPMSITMLLILGGVLILACLPIRQLKSKSLTDFMGRKE